jgi:hypothetical protein
MDQAEPVNVTIDGLQTPYDNAPVIVLTADVPQNDVAQWLVEAVPPINAVPAAAFRNATYMRFAIAGISATGMPLFAGAWMYGNTQRRADKSVREANG